MKLSCEGKAEHDRGKSVSYTALMYSVFGVFEAAKRGQDPVLASFAPLAWTCTVAVTIMHFSISHGSTKLVEYKSLEREKVIAFCLYVLL